MKKNKLIIIAALLVQISCSEYKYDKEELIVNNVEFIDNDEDFIGNKIGIPVNIVLYNQPLDTIQKYIRGKWKLMYGNGGITGRSTYKCDDCYTEFTSDNRVLIPDKTGGYFADTTMEWTRSIALYTNQEYTYIMKFYDKYGYPQIYVFLKIYNDILICSDNMCDGFLYYYTKID